MKPNPLAIAALSLALLACAPREMPVAEPAPAPAPAAAQPGAPGKAVVYQVFTRLFGNKTTTNEPWGTIERNGVGKFSDFDDTALAAIRELGVTHIWYTGVPHHAVIRDYTAYGIDNDDPDVVKGRAGSPYAVKDYYNVDPDLADDPADRLAEFDALIARTHRHGMRVIIDIVPNHVARNYRSLNAPDGIADFGADDDTSVVYARDNNFYYVPGEPFRVPEPEGGYQPLGGEPHPLADGRFDEVPAKWTGNGARAPQPAFNDWYETVKINYGVRPDGTHDFPALPAAYAERGYEAHADFWRGRDVPDSWRKFRDIALFWTERGVDGFRYDMAEMVPVAFWSYLNAAIKSANPDAFLLAEVYQPALYRDYLGRGLMDYLYDKVGLYDTLKAVMRGEARTGAILEAQADVADIEARMLHFLENHDEQRIASPAFAADARAGMPAMVVSVTIGSSPTLLYFGQEVGEPGDGDAGFGDPTRTTIFDYWGVPAHQRWMNGGRFDGGALTPAERALREFYARLLRFSASSPALTGHFFELHTANGASDGYDDRVFAFARWRGESRLVVASNFSRSEAREFELAVPAGLIASWRLDDGSHRLRDALTDASHAPLRVGDGRGAISVRLAPLASVILQVGPAD